MFFPYLDRVDTEKKERRRIQRKEKRAAATMKGVVEEKNVATKGTLDFNKAFSHEKNHSFFDKRKKDRTKSKTGRSDRGRVSYLR